MVECVTWPEDDGVESAIRNWIGRGSGTKGIAFVVAKATSIKTVSAPESRKHCAEICLEPKVRVPVRMNFVLAEECERE